MTKIKLSYENAQELHVVLKLLTPVIEKCKFSKNKEGNYKKAYINIRQKELNEVSTADTHKTQIIEEIYDIQSVCLLNTILEIIRNVKK